MNERKSLFFRWQAVVLLIMAALVLPVSLEAQAPVPVTISREKIVVEGKVYYMHQVLKGQTLYSIARAYSISVDQLTRENEITDNSIKDGQVLRIPAAAVAQGQAAMKNTAAGNQPWTNSQTSQSGQPSRSTQGSQGAQSGQSTQGSQSGQPSRSTQGSLSGQSGQTGQGRSTVTNAETRSQVPRTSVTQDERYIHHRVRRGETLGTIANDYGISVRDLKRANRGLLFPHEGDYLLIPRDKVSGTGPAGRTDQEQVAGVAQSDTIIADTLSLNEEAEVFTVPGDKTVINRLDGSIRVAVLFPFFIRENSARAYADTAATDVAGTSRESARPASAIYDGSLPFLEAYEGVLIAADSLRSLGLTVEMEVYDTGADSAEVKRLLRSGAIEDADLIIGPVFSHNLEQIAGWAAERDIPVVSPVPLRDSHIHENKPTLYRVFPSQAAVQEVIAAEAGSYPGSKIIFIHSDSAMYDPATVRLWQLVKEAAGETPDAGSSRVIPYYFTGVTEKRNVYSSVASFESLLDQGSANIIVLATTSTPVVSSAFSALHSLTKRYNIMVVGYPEIRGFETIDLKYFYDLELYIPTESYIDFDSPSARAFSSVFMKKFRTEPMAESFAWRGFDIGWYFMGGIATGGKQFLRDPGTFNPALLSLEPDFRRERRQDGYENRGMFMLHYRKDMTIEIRKPVRQPRSPYVEGDEVSSPFSGSSGHNRSGLAGRQD